MRHDSGSATIISRQQILNILAASLIAVLAALSPNRAGAEWASGTAAAPVRSIFGSATLKRRGLGMTSQWNRVLDRLPKLSVALSACAADPARCTAPWMGTWLRARRAAEGLGRGEQLRAVNRFFNRWPYKSDRETYQTSEYWAAPDEFMSYSGDCEDYAIAKFFALRELGFTNRELRIAVVYDNRRRIGHAVLAVYTESDILILNNQTDTIASHTHYDNFVPWYLINETNLWTAAGPALSALIPEISVAGSPARTSFGYRARARWAAPGPPHAEVREGPALGNYLPSPWLNSLGFRERKP